ncbi:SEL1-like repeat protein [Endozoicomonas arenosclerae]|uniref:SEL1-like repeat protein n=1 Tax=Endozoicomonas arenosclerae TaxID=1633495 RepID=UPI00078195D1|nr:SEL1-like repeat protein [Endozoicomonas arenosclerae]
MRMRMTGIFLLSALVVTVLSGCQTVTTEATPMRPGLYSTPFSLSPAGCSKVLHGSSQLPIDLYHAGVCYEQGIGTPASTAQAVESYTMAARWGIPEAMQALKRLDKPVPDADLLKRRTEQENQLNKQRLDKEKLDVYKSRGSYPAPHYHYHCGRTWCY